jgi:hypothetical protein
MSEDSPKRQGLESEFRGLQILWGMELRSEQPDWGFLQELNERLEMVEMQLALDEWL